MAAALLAGGLAIAPAAQSADGDYLGRGLMAFDAGGTNGDAAGGVAVQPDGKVVLVGTAVTGSGTWSLALSRSLPNGAADATFGTNGKALDPFGFSSNATGVALQLLPDGRILVAGTLVYGSGDEDFFVGRLLAGGTPDTTFGGSGSGYRILGFDFGGDLTDTLSAMAVDPQGRIVVVGSVDVSETDVDIGAARLTAAGGLDSSFSGDGFAIIPVSASSPDHGLAVAIDRSGRIVIGGATWDSLAMQANYDAVIVVLLANGTPDTSFDGDGKFVFLLSEAGNKNDFCWAIGVWPDGEIVAAGDFATGTNEWAWFAFRVSANGTSWESKTAAFCSVDYFPCAHPPQDSVRALLLEPDGKVVLAGFGLAAPGSIDFGLARLDRDFFWDPAFADDGTTLYDFGLGEGTHADLGTALAFDRDGRLVVGGTVEYNGFDTDFGWARFESSYVFADGFEWGSTSPWSGGT